MRFMKNLFFASIVVILGLIIFSNTKFLSASKQIMVNSEKNNTKLAGYKCSDGWRITAYFTPIETEYDSNETHEVEIKKTFRKQ